MKYKNADKYKIRISKTNIQNYIEDFICLTLDFTDLISIFIISIYIIGNPLLLNNLRNGMFIDIKNRILQQILYLSFSKKRDFERCNVRIYTSHFRLPSIRSSFEYHGNT